MLEYFLHDLVVVIGVLVMIYLYGKADGRYLLVWYDEQVGVCTNRMGMGMCLAWQGLVVERKRWRQEAGND